MYEPAVASRAKTEEHEGRFSGIMFKVIMVQGIVVPRRCEILIHSYGKNGKIRFEVRSLRNAIDELF